MVFNKGLDSSGLRMAGMREIPISSSLQKLKSDSRIKDRGFELPSVAKLGTGYLPSSGLGRVLRTEPMKGNQTVSGSDMDLSSGSEGSVVSSPQDDKIGFGVDLRKTTQLKQGSRVEILGGNLDWKFVKKAGFRGDDMPDSATSTEISFTQMGSNNLCGGRHTSDSYSSSLSSKAYRETAAGQDIVGRGLQGKFSNTDNPSAPPLDANSNNFRSTKVSRETGNIPSSNSSARVASGLESAATLPTSLPAFHARLASEQGTWCAVVSYDACVRLCLHAWALQGSSEVHSFLENECALLRDAFGLRYVLLRSEDELLEKQSAELVSQGAAQKARKTSGNIKLQVRKVKIGSDPLPVCYSLSSLKSSVVKKESLRRGFHNVKLNMFTTWTSLRKVRLAPQVPVNGSFSGRSLAYMQASTNYMKQISGVLKVGATNLCKRSSSSSSDESVHETYSCLLKLKSSAEDDVVRMRPGSSESHIFFPDSLGDDLIIDVQDSKGHSYGRVVAQVAVIADNPDEKLRWWTIYGDSANEPVGRVQLYINYTTTESSNPKCGSVAETVAYDFLLEVALKVQHFHQRNLLLKNPWRWLVTEFASYYGVSDEYTKLRYLSYIMDVATPTNYCLNLVYDLLSHVLMNGKSKSTLSHQEKRILADIDEQVKNILALVFENYKSLDETSQSGMMDVFTPASGSVAPALVPAVKLYTLLHDILSPEAQLKFCRYFQAATKKRLRRHLAETDEVTQSSNEGRLMDLFLSYDKMKSLILNVRNEISTDLEIHNQHVLPSFIDLPNISSSIYSVELCIRLRAFLIACPPPGPCPPVSELVITAADLQKDLAFWNVNPVNGGVDAKGLFNSYITHWIQDKRHQLLELCKQDQERLCGMGTQQSTSPFVDDMFRLLKETINEYQIILCRWPEYISILENAIADVEKATVEALEKHYADVLLPLKDNLTNKILGLKYVQKLSKGTVNTYSIPDELGILLNSMKRLLDVLCPKIETQLKSFSSCIPDDGNPVIGEHLNDVKVMLRAKFRNYRHAIVEKLVENTRVQSATKLRSIIRDSKEVESEIQTRMQPLKDLLIKTIHHLDNVVEPLVFVEICREFWDRMGQDILHLLEEKGEKRPWYKGLRVAVSILDDIFASEMQKLRGNSLQGKDLEPPASIKEMHSMLSKDAGC
ncbi:hypothetical protein UlMin_038773 [Ulmus minor]